MRSHPMLSLSLVAMLVACGPTPETTDGPEAPDPAAPTADEAAPDPVTEDRTATPSAKPSPDAGAAQVLQGIPGEIPLPDRDTPTPPLAEDSLVEYACESGSALRIRYRGATAEVAWTGGESLVLSRIAPGAEGGERYEGDGHALSRRGNVVELRAEGAGRTWRCAEGASNA